MDVRLNLLGRFGKSGGYGEHVWQWSSNVDLHQDIKSAAQQLTAICEEVRGECVLNTRICDKNLVLVGSPASKLDATSREHLQAEVLEIESIELTILLPGIIKEIIEARRMGQRLHGHQITVQTAPSPAADILWTAVVRCALDDSSAFVRNPSQASSLVQLLGDDAFNWLGYFNRLVPSKLPNGIGIVICSSASDPISTQVDTHAEALQRFRTAHPHSKFFELLMKAPVEVRRLAVNCLVPGSEPCDLHLLPWPIRSELMLCEEESNRLLQSLPSSQFSEWLASTHFSLDRLQIVRIQTLHDRADDLFERLISLPLASFGPLKSLDAALPEYLTVTKLVQLLPERSAAAFQQLSDGRTVDANVAERLLSDIHTLEFFEKLPSSFIACAAKSGSRLARKRIGEELERLGLNQITVAYLLDDQQVWDPQICLDRHIEPNLVTALKPFAIMEGVLKTGGSSEYWRDAFSSSLEKGAISVDQVCEFSRIRRTTLLIDLCETPQYLRQLIAFQEEIVLPPLRDESDWHPQCDLLLEEECHNLISYLQFHGVPADFESNGLILHRLCLAEFGQSFEERREHFLQWIEHRGAFPQMKTVLGWFRNLFRNKSVEPLAPHRIRAVLRLLSRNEVLDQIQKWSNQQRSDARTESLQLLISSMRLVNSERRWISSHLLDWQVIPLFPDTFSASDLESIIQIEGIELANVLKYCLLNHPSFLTQSLADLLVNRIRATNIAPPALPVPAEISECQRGLLKRLSALSGWESILGNDAKGI